MITRSNLILKLRVNYQTKIEHPHFPSILTEKMAFQDVKTTFQVAQVITKPTISHAKLAH